MRSDDQGNTWTEPTDAQHGLLTDEGQYHTAPVPVIVHDGRLWRAVEDAMGGTQWGERYRARMLSAPVDADLLQRDSWTLSSPLARDPQWLDSQFGGWLEGNAVVTPLGQMVNILRVACPAGGKAAVVRVSPDGKSALFDPTRDIIDFPGGAKKFTIRHDSQSRAYWTLANPVLPRHAGQAPAASIRNTLALMRSDDLRSCAYALFCCITRISSSTDFSIPTGWSRGTTSSRQSALLATMDWAGPTTLTTPTFSPFIALPDSAT